MIHLFKCVDKTETTMKSKTEILLRWFESRSILRRPSYKAICYTNKRIGKEKKKIKGQVFNQILRISKDFYFIETLVFLNLSKIY